MTTPIVPAGSVGTPAATVPGAPAPERRRPHWGWGLAGALLAGAALLLAFTVRLPYYEERPGTADSVTTLIQADPAHRHAVSGDILLATVSLTSRVTPVDVLAAWLDPNADIVSEKVLTGGAPAPQFNQDNAVEMDQSKQLAVVLALRRLGYSVPEHGDGVLVATVDARSGAAGRLRAGDVVLGVDGRAVAIASDLTSVIRSHRPGDVLTLDVRSAKANATHREVVPLTSCPTDVCGNNSSRAYLGIGLATAGDRFDFPFKASINLSDVGGPSAGLSFTLALLDTLGNGNLTGGHKVAATGTIDAEGNVGPIGGMALKTVAVERAGVDVFLVPKDTGIPGDDPQYSAAVAKARGHRLKVFAVGTLDDALRVLQSLGGDVRGITPPPAAPSA